MNNEDFDADFFAELDTPDDDFFAELDAPASGPFDQPAPATYASTPADSSAPSGPFSGTISADNSRAGLGQPARFGGMLRKPVAGAVEVVRDVWNKGTDANIDGAWERGIALSDNAAEGFRKERPVVAGLADTAADIALIAGTGGLGGGALGTSIASRLPAATPALVSRALPMAAGGAVTGGALGFSERGDLGDAAKGAGLGTAFGAAGALAPVTTMVAGAGLATADAADAFKDGDVYRATRALADIGLDLGLGAGGAALKRRVANHVEAERKLGDYEAMAREPLDADVRKREQDLRTSQGNLEAVQERAKVLPGEDLSDVDVAFRRDVSDLQKRQTQRQADLKKVDEDIELARARNLEGFLTEARKEAERVRRNEISIEEGQARIDALRQQLEVRDQALATRRENAAIKDENRQRQADLRGATQELQREGRRQLVEAPKDMPESKRLRQDYDVEIAQAQRELAEARAATTEEANQQGVSVDVENHPSVVRAKERLAQAQEAASPETLAMRVSQKEIKQFQDSMNAYDRAVKMVQDPNLPAEIRADAQHELETSQRVIENLMRRHKATKSQLERLLLREDPEELAAFERRITQEAQGNVRVAEAQLEQTKQRLLDAVERKAQKTPQDPAVQAINLLKAQAKEAVARTVQAEAARDNSPQAREAARQRAVAKVDPVAAVPPERAVEILRGFGIEAPSGENAREILRAVAVEGLTPTKEVPDVGRLSIEERIRREEAKLSRLRDGGSELADLPEGDFVQRAVAAGFTPEEALAVFRGEGTPDDVRMKRLLNRREELASQPLVSRAPNPYADPELRAAIEEAAVARGIDPSTLSAATFEPGAAPVRRAPRPESEATVPDEGRQVFLPGEDLPANAARQKNLQEQFNLQERIRGQEADLAEAQAALADLLGPNEEGRRILQQLQDQQSVDFSLTGAANFLKDKFASADGRGAAARLAARNPKAAVYFYRQLAQQMAVPESTIARFEGLILAEGVSAAERAERLIYAINQALNQQP